MIKDFSSVKGRNPNSKKTERKITMHEKKVTSFRGKKKKKKLQQKDFGRIKSMAWLREREKGNKTNNRQESSRISKAGHRPGLKRYLKQNNSETENLHSINSYQVRKRGER